MIVHIYSIHVYTELYGFSGVPILTSTSIYVHIQYRDVDHMRKVAAEEFSRIRNAAIF